MFQSLHLPGVTSEGKISVPLMEFEPVIQSNLSL